VLDSFGVLAGAERRVALFGVVHGGVAVLWRRERIGL
jgi:hypothetical protein